MDWFNAFLPLWILGAPLLWAVVERMRTPKVHGSTQEAGHRRTTAAA